VRRSRLGYHGQHPTVRSAISRRQQGCDATALILPNDAHALVNSDKSPSTFEFGSIGLARKNRCTVS
jgi:hypothetical protein